MANPLKVALPTLNLSKVYEPKVVVESKNNMGMGRIYGTANSHQVDFGKLSDHQRYYLGLRDARAYKDEVTGHQKPWDKSPRHDISSRNYQKQLHQLDLWNLSEKLTAATDRGQTPSRAKLNQIVDQHIAARPAINPDDTLNGGWFSKADTLRVLVPQLLAPKTEK